MSKSVDIADQARREAIDENLTSFKLLVAASIGPYGACVGDGSEYDGSYGEKLGEEFLFKWHEPRFTVLVNNESTDILAIETIPCITEVKALL